MLGTNTELKSSFAGEVVTALDQVLDYLLAMAPAEGNGADIQLSFSEVRAAKQVPDEGFISMRHLAASMGVPLSTATHVVDRLVVKGVVVRIRPKHDRRLVLVELSERSKEHRQLLFRERVALIAQIMEPLGDAAREQVVRVLSQIAERAASHRAALLARSEAGATAPSQAGTGS
jgi:DNA-binding MarR family transcriptional regulator